jgi:hypothetical protein
MKTNEIKTRLNLNKETIADLGIDMMAQVVGGTGPTTDTNGSVVDCDKIPSYACTRT